MLALKLPTGMAPGVNQAGLALIQTWNNKLPKALPGNDAVAYGTQVEPFHIMVHTSHASAGAQFFPLDQDQISNPSPQKVTATKYGFALDVKKDDSLKTPPDVLNGLLVFGDGTAYEIHAKHSALGYVSSVPSPAVKETGLLNALGLAFIGGIILNLNAVRLPGALHQGAVLSSSLRAKPAARCACMAWSTRSASLSPSGQ